MKYFLIIFLVLCALSGFTQTFDDNTILAHGVTIEQVKKTLLDQHYKFSKDNIRDSTVLTQEKYCRRCTVKIFLLIKVSDSVAVIKGKYWGHDLIYGTPGRYYPGKAHEYNISCSSIASNERFIELDRIAQLLSTDGTYERQ